MSSPLDIIGGMFAGFGIVQERGDQANAYLDDVQAYNQQIAYVQKVGARKLDLLSQDQSSFNGRKEAMFAKAGVGFDSTVLNSLAGDRVEQFNEQSAVKAETEQNLRDLRTQAAQASARADSLLDPWNTFVSVLGGTMPYAKNAVTGIDSESANTSKISSRGMGVNYRSKY